MLPGTSWRKATRHRPDWPSSRAKRGELRAAAVPVEQARQQHTAAAARLSERGCPRGAARSCPGAQGAGPGCPRGRRQPAGSSGWTPWSSAWLWRPGNWPPSWLTASRAWSAAAASTRHRPSLPAPGRMPSERRRRPRRTDPARKSAANAPQTLAGAQQALAVLAERGGDGGRTSTPPTRWTASTAALAEATDGGRPARGLGAGGGAAGDGHCQLRGAAACGQGIRGIPGRCKRGVGQGKPAIVGGPGGRQVRL